MDLGGGSTEFWSANRLRLLCCPSTRPPCLSGSWKILFLHSVDVWLLMEENIIQSRACLDLDRYWSKTHFLRPLVGDSIRSNLVIPHIAILPHCLTLPFVWLLITLDLTWWSLTLPEMMCSSLKLSLSIGSFGESLSLSVRYFSSFFSTCVSTPSVVSEFPRALLWIPVSHSYFSHRLLDCFLSHHFVTIITLLHEEETITNLVPHFSGQQRPQQLQEPTKRMTI